MGVYYSQYMASHKIHVPNRQPDIIKIKLFGGIAA
jgi:hypothetical protein